MTFKMAVSCAFTYLANVFQLKLKGVLVKILVKFLFPILKIVFFQPSFDSGVDQSSMKRSFTTLPMDPGPRPSSPYSPEMQRESEFKMICFCMNTPLLWFILSVIMFLICA